MSVRKLKKYWPFFVLLGVEILLFVINYQPGTWLIGWDSTQPELNLGLNLQRILSSVWQEYRGLGVADGMAHNANITHWLYVLVLSKIVGIVSVRYVFVSIMHLLGGVGMYVFVRSLAKKNRGQIALLIPALFYMFNPLSVQMFYQPLELFVIHYASLPWIIYWLLRYLKQGRRRDLVLFGLVQILFVSQYHVPTIFIVNSIAMGVVGLGYLGSKRRGVRKRILRVLLVYLGTSAFWLLPYGANIVKQSSMITGSKINELSNPEVVLQQESYGDFYSVVEMRGFGLSYVDWGDDYQYDLQMPQWEAWWGNEWIRMMGWVIMGLIVWGMIEAWGKEGVVGKSMGVLMIIVWVNLGARIVGFSVLHDWLFTLPLYEEVFRFVFTKYAFLYAFLSSYFLYILVKRVGRNGGLGIVVLSGVILIRVLPVFRGEMYYDRLVVDVPDEYQSLFDYSSELGGERMAYFPVVSYWGWESNEWGYRGSGFIWQGVGQPMLHPSFNAWSSYNESFYHEISRAVYSGDTERMREVLDKYDVRYVLVDESVVEPGKEKDSLRFDESKEMLRNLGSKEIFREGFLSIWEMNGLYVEQNSFVDAPSEYTFLQGDTVYGRSGVLLGSAGDYVERGDAYFPFADLTREKVEGVSYRGDVLGRERVVLERDIGGYSSMLYVPPFTVGTEVSIPISVLYKNDQIKISFESFVRAQEFSYPELGDVLLDGIVGSEVMLGLGESLIDVKLDSEVRGVVRLRVGEPVLIEVYNKDLVRVYSVDEQFATKEVAQCWAREGGSPFVGSSRSGNELTIITRDAAGCVSLRLGDLGDGIVDVSLPYLSHDGSRPNFCLNEASGQYECLHDDVFYSTGPSSSWSSVARRVSIESGEYWLDVTARPSDVVGEQWSIDYRAPSISYYPQILNAIVDANFFEPMLNSQEIELADTDKLILELITLPVNIDYGLNGKGMAENCDVLGRGDVSKVVDGDGVTYKADDRGAACDALLLGEVSQSGEYFMRFRGEQIKGRSLKSYLYSPSTLRNELEVLLPGGEYDTSFAVLSQKDRNINYSMSVETRSFGQKAEHRVNSVEAYPVPISWLAEFRLGEISKGDNGLSIDDVVKSGTWKYVVSGEMKGEQGLVVLSQGYDEGWIAWVRGGEHKFLQHVRVNGWKNGWIVDDSEGEQVVIMIVYWPQLLQWLGFGLMGGFGLLLVRRKK